MREKFFSIICAFSLLINSLFPIFSVGAVYAEDSTGSATVASPSPAASEAPSPSPSIEPTDAPTPLPSSDPTPTPIINPNPEISPQPIVSTTPSTEPENTPFPTPDENVGQANAPPEESPSPAPTPEPSPSADVEQAPTGYLSATILENTDANSLHLDLTTQSDVLSASLSTDKADYAPTDTAVITGADFPKSADLKLIITADNYRFETEVKTDTNGTFTYFYQLDGTYRPLYSIVAQDLSGQILATTTFTDSPGYSCVSDSAGANDEPGQKDLTALCRDLGSNDPLQITWNWDVTSMSGSNTADACALFDTNNNGFANYSLCVTWDRNQHQITGSPSLYSCSDTRVDRCAGAALVSTAITSTCTVANGSDDPFAAGDSFPNDTKATCSIPLSDVGGATRASLLDVCSYPSVQPNSDPSDCIIIRSDKGNLTVIKDVSPDNANTNWNFAVNGPTNFNAAISGDGTSGINSVDLGTYSITETAGNNTSLSGYNTTWSCTKNGSAYLSGSGATASGIVLGRTGNVEDSVICTFTNTLQNGTVIVHKDVRGPNGEDITDNTSFTVSLDGTNAQSITESTTATYNNVAAGTHTVTEGTPPAGYSLFSMTPDTDAGTGGAQFTVNPGQTTDVYVVNREQQTTLTLVKTVINDNGGTKQVADFTLKIDGSNVTSGVANVVSAGAHTASEVSQTGYTASAWGRDCSSDGTITLALGDNKTCTITNDDTPAHLIVIKNVVNDNGGNAAPSDFNMTINNVTASGGNSFPGQAAPGTDKTLTTVGSYSVTESGPSGYDDSYSSDCNGSIALGQTKTCTITNNDIAPTIKIIKNVINDNSGNASSNDFGLTVGGQSVSSGQTLAVNANIPLSINETGLSGYSFVSITGEAKCPQALGGTVTLGEGENVTCTITNNDNAPSLTLVKVVTKDNGGTARPSDWTLTASGPTGFSGPGPSVSNGASFDAGTYNLSESAGPAGYSASAWSCQGGTQDGNKITLNLGDSATCTITNDDQAGTLIVKKIVKNDNGGTLRENDFSFKVNNGGAVPFEADGQNNLTVDAGTYNIIEPAVSGYDTTYDNCSNVVISNGGIQTCTITNNDIAPTIVLNKIVNNNFGGQAGVNDFGLSVGGVNVNSGQTATVLANTAYAINEAGLSGYSFVSITGEGCPITLGGSVTLNPGQNITCTITNEDIAPSLTLVKFLPNDNGGTATESDFKVYINGQITSWGQRNLNAGQYTISEDTLIGYTPSAWGGDCDVDGTITLNPGDNKICTITNDDVAPTLTLVKNLPNDNDGTATQDDFSVYINDEEADWGINTVDAGDLTVSEDTLPGYEPSGWSGDCNEDGNITLLPGDNKTCTITNDDQPAHLILVKNLPNDNGGTATQDDFGVFIDGQEAVWDDNEVNAGSHTVNENTLPGYTPSAWGQDCDENGNVSLLPGETKTCTITNDDIAPILTLVKNLPNDNGGTATEEDFNVYINGELSSWGEHTLLAGSYTISEDTISGYTPSAWGTDCAENGTIALNVGDEKTCSITNDDEPGKISGKKFNDKNGDHIRTNTTTDPNLPDWTITLDKVNDINPPVCTSGTVIGELCVTTTNSFGNYAFNGLEPGTYLVSEVLQTGWTQTRPGLFNETLYGGQGAQADGTYLLILQSGDDIDNRDFGNQGQGTITVHKNVDTNGDGEMDEENVTDWTWDIGGQGDFATGDNSQEVSAGTYTISEDQKEGFHVTLVSCNNDQSYDPSERIEVAVAPGQNLICTFINTRDTGTITVLKDIDNNGDGDSDDVGDIKGATDWTWDIANGDQNIATGQTKTLPTGNYTITEDQQDSYNLLGWSCSNEQTGTENSIAIEVTKNSKTTCTFTNQLQPPVLTLTKANNRTGIDVSAGADVLYTLTVTLAGSPLSNVSLIDLPPAGFKYRSGSWTAVSSERGDLKPAITSEPTYASPGTWSLGDMVTEETVTLTYIADIDSSTDPGLYKDLAWSSGEGQTSSTVLANENSGFFVGTEVNVVAGSGDSAGVNVVREERGEVLGVSTELPQTGINTLWSILAVLLLASGAGLIFAGISLRRKYE